MSNHILLDDETSVLMKDAELAHFVLHEPKLDVRCYMYPVHLLVFPLLEPSTNPSFKGTDRGGTHEKRNDHHRKRQLTVLVQKVRRDGTHDIHFPRVVPRAQTKPCKSIEGSYNRTSRNLLPRVQFDLHSVRETDDGVDRQGYLRPRNVASDKGGDETERHGVGARHSLVAWFQVNIFRMFQFGRSSLIDELFQDFGENAVGNRADEKRYHEGVAFPSEDRKEGYGN